MKVCLWARGSGRLGHWRGHAWPTLRRRRLLWPRCTCGKGPGAGMSTCMLWRRRLLWPRGSGRPANSDALLGRLASGSCRHVDGDGRRAPGSPTAHDGASGSPTAHDGAPGSPTAHVSSSLGDLDSWRSPWHLLDQGCGRGAALDRHVRCLLTQAQVAAAHEAVVLTQGRPAL